MLQHQKNSQVFLDYINYLSELEIVTEFLLFFVLAR